MTNDSFSPLTIANRRQAAENHPDYEWAKQFTEYPRLGELLWFIQAMSMLPGGLQAMAKRILEWFPDRFITAAMRRVGPPNARGRYTLEQCLEVWKEARNDFRFGYEYEIRDPDSFKDWLYQYIGNDTTAESLKWQRDPLRTKIAMGLEHFNVDFLKARCLKRAGGIASYLESLYQAMNQNFAGDPFWEYGFRVLSGEYHCPDLPQVLFDYLDRYAQEAGAELAQTEIAAKIFSEIEFARTEKVPVVFLGDSRFGKTKAASVYCRMYPGRARLVTVPPSNSERDLFEAHAEAFGIPFTPKTKTAGLRRQVEFVIRHGGLSLIIYDESHYLIPQSYTGTTAPRRLNWIRANIIDRHIGCVFFTTIQSHKATFEKFRRKPHWSNRWT